MKRLLGAALIGAAASVPVAAEPITAERLMTHIRILADDSYEGREAGTPGGERAEAYILDAFAKAGLRPGAGSSWRQTIDIVARTPVATRLAFSRNGTAVALPADSIVLTGADTAVDLATAPVLFAGYATEPELAGISVKDAVVAMLQGQPPESRSVGSWQDRRQALLDAGAAAVIHVEPADRPWDAAAKRSQRVIAPGNDAFGPARGPMSHAAATVLLGRTMLGAAARRGFRARRLPLTVSGQVTTRIDQIDPANIVGMVKGSGDGREPVVMMSHWDHTGICRPPGAPDRICNGAIDNASGIAVLIETAREIAAGPKPVRDIYFLATALEEAGGFLGATAFAQRPAEPRPVAVLNVDTIAIHPRGLPVAIIGRGRFPSLDRVIDATSRQLGRKVDLDDEANVMIERQDGWAFTKLGIPSVMASGSFSDMKLLTAYLGTTYHQPNDDLKQKIEIGGAVEDADLHVALLRALADPKIYPTP
ncbi:M28 family peptidase [Sphingomonas lutea]|uniref:M28 family peptidase n=1 Tax=Sphingomonas lutea TaxID=1045317 RepID=A0A7G9SJV6_9SPHN|nr:M28 family peptidase [Sphingomonas lutea]QNN68131.1 M28 family peptidase [Sphingomonas lutea]